MEQVTAGCSSKMVVKIGAVYYRYFIAFLGAYFRFPLYHTRQCFSTEKTPCIAERLSHSLLSHHPEHLLGHRLFISHRLHPLPDGSEPGAFAVDY